MISIPENGFQRKFGLQLIVSCSVLIKFEFSKRFAANTFESLEEIQKFKNTAL